MLLPTARLRAITPYVFATLAEKKRARLATGASVIDLSLGSPDQPTPTPIIDALAAAARDPSRHGYPNFTGDLTFKKSFADYLQRRFGVTVDPVAELVPTAGSKEALAHIVSTFCEEGDVVLVTDVAYPVYERAAMSAGAETVALPVSEEGNWWPDLKAVPEEVRRRAKLLVLNFPNNPTGATTTLAKLAEAVEFARANELIFISDLAYSELTFVGEPAPSVLQVPGALDWAIEIHSGSKNFSMAGLRLGMVVGSAEFCRALNGFRNLVGYGAPTVIQLAGAMAYERAEELSGQLRAGYQARIEAACAGFAAGGHAVDGPSGGMYLWFRTPEGMTDWEVTNALIDREGIILTPGSGFGAGGAGWLRLSLVAAPAVLEAAAKRVASVFR
ncbi:MAG: aminotransferase class I/II-fold pyridoxal phosphate-dependent enzyme [Gemmatimonadota bacterium]